MDEKSTGLTLKRWEVILHRQCRRLVKLQELVIGQDYLTVIDPDTKARMEEIVGYKIERANSLHGIGAALEIRFMLPIAKSSEDRARYVSVMVGSQSDLLDIGKIEQEIGDLSESLENYREIVLRLLSVDEITRLSDEARKETAFD